MTNTLPLMSASVDDLRPPMAMLMLLRSLASPSSISLRIRALSSSCAWCFARP